METRWRQARTTICKSLCSVASSTLRISHSQHIPLTRSTFIAGTSLALGRVGPVGSCWRGGGGRSLHSTPIESSASKHNLEIASATANASFGSLSTHFGRLMRLSLAPSISALSSCLSFSRTPSALCISLRLSLSLSKSAACLVSCRVCLVPCPTWRIRNLVMCCSLPIANQCLWCIRKLAQAL